MKINRWIALTLIALLLLGAMGFVSYRVFASANRAHPSQDCAVEAQDDDVNEAADAKENDDGEECADQGNEEDEAQEGNGQATSDEAAPANTAITAEEAQAIAEKANPGVSTLNVEFDSEWGKAVWEVELDNGMDVKVDASTGEILETEKRD